MHAGLLVCYRPLADAIRGFGFGSYLVEGFAVLAYFGHVATPVAFLPVAVQFVGRWGLYRFVTNKFNIVPGHAYYDACLLYTSPSPRD